MAKPHSKPGHVLILTLVASLLALLVGLVRLVQRGASAPRSLTWVEAPRREPKPQVLRTPIDLASIAPEAQASSKVKPVAPPGPAMAETTREERARLVGHVMRPEGDAASQARVVLGQQHARCDAQGRFEIVLQEDAGAADLIAFEPGYEPALRPGFGSTLVGGESYVRLFLGPETLSLAGTVVETGGAPLKGWTVELDGLDPLQPFGLRERVRTDADGRFLLTDVPSGVWVVRAWKERPEAAARSEAVAAGESGLVIRVDDPQ